MTVTRILSRTTTALLLLAVLTVPAWAQPALWQARKGDATVYLFGTIHMLPDAEDWHYPALEKALQASDTLYVEITKDQATSDALLPKVMQYGLDRTHPLSQKLNSTEHQRLVDAAEQIDLPGGADSLDIMKPWLAALTLSVAPLKKAGMDPEHGVDMQLQERMQQAGKPVHGLETGEQQIRTLADLPEDVQLDMLRSTLRDFADAEQQFTRILDAWGAGDTDTLRQLTTGPMAENTPQLYAQLLVARNDKWADKIKQIMARTDDPVFVAVGAAHLVGDDRLQEKLRARGMTVNRVAPEAETDAALDAETD